MHRILPPAQHWPLHTGATTRRIEAETAGELPPHTLMRRAGEALARLTMAVAPHAKRIWIAAGPGNNGGDGFEAATRLQAWGRQVLVTWVGTTEGDGKVPADAFDARQRAIEAGVQIVSHPPATWQTFDVAIDALLGIGATRAPADLIAECIRMLNDMTCPVLAVDLPSGLATDTGSWLGDLCVHADHTLALLTLKPGLFTASGRDQSGTIWLDRLAVTVQEPPDCWLSGAETRASSRLHVQHKGSFGDLAVIGGAVGMAGAAFLAARAALAAGAGRVIVDWLQDPAAGALAVDGMHPELMMRTDWSYSGRSVLADSTVVCGCGGGDAVHEKLPRLLSLAGRLVIDADALNAIAIDPQLMAILQSRGHRSLVSVLTPHPLEAARLLKCDTAAVQSDRLGAARALTDLTGCVVILKGSGSIIAAPGCTPHINGTGNGSLAGGGTGDVLAGWLGGLWAQVGRRGGADETSIAFETASQAVADHGAAAEPLLPGALPASELVRRLHRNLRQGRPRLLHV